MKSPSSIVVRLRLLLPVIFLCALGARVSAAELVRNGNFSGGMADWAKAPEYVQDPVSSGRASISQPTTGSSSIYVGPVISQGLNVSGIAGQTMTASVKLAKNYPNLPPGNSIKVNLEYTLSGGGRASVAAIAPSNSAVWPPGSPSGTFTTFTQNVTFPPTAVKLVGISIHLTGIGAFLVDDLSLTGSFTAGPVPTITGVSTAVAGYGDLVTVTGSDLGGVPGALMVGGTSSGVAIDYWSNTSVVFHLINPSHGGLIHLVTDDVMDSQNWTVGVSSPHYVVSVPKPKVFAVPGQVVEFDALVAFYNNFTTPTGVSLSVPGAAAAFAPEVVKYQGGSRVSLNTAGLAAGQHGFNIESTDGTTPANPVALVIDIRTPDRLILGYEDPDTFESVTLGTGETLVIDSFQAVTTSYRLEDAAGTNITSAGPLQWAASNPAVLSIRPRSAAGDGPVLVPMADGVCNLTATAVNGFTVTIPVQVGVISAPGMIDSIGFTSTTSDNSGSGPFNQFNATTNDGGSIDVETEDMSGSFSVGSPFRVPFGQAPGVYEFIATNSNSFLRRSALLTVVNTAGTGMLRGNLVKSYEYNYSPGKLEFCHPVTGALLFERTFSAYGAYKLGAVPPGSYRLRFVTDNLPGTPLDDVWYPNSPVFAESQPVTITAGATTSNINFFVYKSAAAAVPVTAPKLVNLTRTGGSFGFSFFAESGITYTTQYSTTLTGWTTLEVFVGNDALHGVVDAGASTLKRFYRVVASAP